MAVKHSTMLRLGTPLPYFQLGDVVSGQMITPQVFEGKQCVLVMFICKHCPYVVHVKEELARLGKDYENKNVGIVAICSNDATRYPDDSPDQLKVMVEQMGYSFPLCYDETQETAKVFTAACTPDFFLFGKDRTLVYRGQLDGSRPGTAQPVTGKDVRMALDAVLDGRSVSPDQQPSVGCSIKWKPGNEPKYA